MASIFLAIGHGIQTDGTWDPGCTYGGYTEADLAKPIVGSAVSILKAHGVDVYTDYPENDMNITTCVAYANNHGLNAYMSVHLDYSGAPSGTLPIVHPSSPNGYNLATCVNNSVMNSMGIGTRGILKRYDDWEVSGTDMPACIFEVGSIKADLSTIKDNADKYGQAIAYGILDYFGIAHDGTVAPSQPSQPSRQFTSIYNSNYYLSYGDGPDPNIGQFQRDCNLCGYQGENGKLTVDNMYGSECKHACECLQRWHKIRVDGDFGCDSDIRMMNEIATIQEALNLFGYNLEIDGVCGYKTETAVEDFQAKNGLEPDGICGDKTRALLGIR